MGPKKIAETIFGDEDYLTLDQLVVGITEDVINSDGSFTLCMWIYLMKSSSKGGVIIHQVSLDAEASASPFLGLDSDRKLSVFSLFYDKLDLDGGASINKCCVTAEVPCPLEKWVHIGCEVSTNAICLHIDAVVVGEKRFAYVTQNCAMVKKSMSLKLVGADGNSSCVQGYAHYVRVFAQPAVTNHYVKNPPLELALDGYSGALDDHDLEESGDGVWSVVGGKASCRRHFTLDVVLLDALGRFIHKEMELIALLVYADNGAPVEKPKDEVEAPLLTTFDGVDFPSTERPIKLVHGRASFKLKISQLSSKCDSRLFRVCFDSPQSMSYPFLRVFSRPIHCVSRNRIGRTLSVSRKKSNPSAYQHDVAFSPGIDEPTSESQKENGNNILHGSVMQPSQITPPLKRVRVGHDKLSIRIANDSSPLDHSCDAGSYACNFSGSDKSAQSPPEFPKALHAASPLETAHSHLENGSSGLPMLLPLKLHQTDPLFSVNLDTMSEKFQERNNCVCDTENIHTHKPTAMSRGTSDEVFSDYIIFKYCLENIFYRSLFLKRNIMCRSDQDVADFAARVSEYSGCHHNGYQILITKQLIQEGCDLWKMLTKDIYPLSWNSVIHQIEKRFMMVSRCTRRHFTAQDKEFLRKLAGCSDTVVREDFDHLWQWLFPVALSLSNPQIRKAWENMEPKWIEGMISREEAEALLRTSQGFSKPGMFIIRFPSSRSWPHPDAGALIASYVGSNYGVHHRLISFDERMDIKKPIEELLLAQPELSQVFRASTSPQ